MLIIALGFGFVLVLGAHPLAARAAGTLSPGETLTLTSNDPDESSVTVRLLGVGTP